MIPRYTHPEMGGIWSDQHRYETWLKVEIAAAEAMADAGHHPRRGGARDPRARRRSTSRASRRSRRVTKHDVIAFTTAVAEHVGPAARWLHFGLTSSDVLDTALALQMREACDLILTRPRRAARPPCARGPMEHRRTPMIGRTHGVHAEPTTLRA